MAFAGHSLEHRPPLIIYIYSLFFFDFGFFSFFGLGRFFFFFLFFIFKCVENFLVFAKDNSRAMLVVFQQMGVRHVPKSV